MSEKMIRFKMFNVMQYDLEEDYLRKMHRQGYAFDRISGFYRYHFKKAVPQDVVYKLDYPGSFASQADKNDYLQLFKDAGWEYLGDYNHYTYFRKVVSPKENMEIFSDDDSKLRMIHRIILARVLPVFSLYLAIVVPEMFNIFEGADSPIRWAVHILYFILGVFCLLAFISILLAYIRLRNKLQDPESSPNQSNP